MMLKPMRWQMPRPLPSSWCDVLGVIGGSVVPSRRAASSGLQVFFEFLRQFDGHALGGSQLLQGGFPDGR